MNSLLSKPKAKFCFLSLKARTIEKITKIPEDFTKTFPKWPRTGMEGMDRALNFVT